MCYTALRFELRWLINDTHIYSQLPASRLSKPRTLFMPGAHAPVPLPSGWGRETVLLVRGAAEVNSSPQSRS